MDNRSQESFFKKLDLMIQILSYEEQPRNEVDPIIILSKKKEYPSVSTERESQFP